VLNECRLLFNEADRMLSLVTSRVQGGPKEGNRVLSVVTSGLVEITMS